MPDNLPITERMKRGAKLRGMSVRTYVDEVVEADILDFQQGVKKNVAQLVRPIRQTPVEKTIHVQVEGVARQAPNVEKPIEWAVRKPPSHRPSETERITICELFKAGNSQWRISCATGFSMPAISKILKTAGLPTRHPRRKGLRDREEVARRLQARESQARICREMRISNKHVRELARELGIQPSRWARKVYSEEIKKQATEYPGSLNAAVRKFGMSSATISRWRKAAGIKTGYKFYSAKIQREATKYAAPLRETARKFGVSRTTIFRWRAAAGIQRRKRHGEAKSIHEGRAEDNPANDARGQVTEHDCEAVGCV